MSTGAKFRRFLSNIQLTKPQLEDAKTKHNGVRKTLHDAYYSTSYTGGTSILVGSYGKNTAVRPPSDIDILFVMPPDQYQRYDSYTGNGQSQLLQDAKKILLKTYSTTDIKGDGQVVSVPFQSFAVEVVPVYKTGLSGDYLTPDTHEGGKWKRTNPKAESKNISDSNTESKDNTVHLIKMLKVWKRNCNVEVKSLGIELMAIEFIGGWSNKGNSHVYYDWMIRDFFKYMLTKKDSVFLIPGIFEIYSVGSTWESKANSAFTRAKKACGYERDKNDELANVEWKKIFGYLYIG